MDEPDPQKAFLSMEYAECRSAIGRFDDTLTDLRTKGLAVVLAFDGVAAIVAERGAILQLWGVDVRAAVVIQVVALVLALPLIAMDIMYTRFLVASVKRAEYIEEQFLAEGLTIGKQAAARPLTQALSKVFPQGVATTFIQIIVYGLTFGGGIFMAWFYWNAKIVTL